MALDEQAGVLGELQEIHGKVRQVKIDSLKRELAGLEDGSTNGHATRKAAKRGPKKGGVKVKYCDPNQVKHGAVVAAWRGGWLTRSSRARSRTNI